MKRIAIVVIGLVTVFFHFVSTVLAVTPQQLREMLNKGDKVTVIDIRNTDLYTEGHIQGAINIPASIIAKKRIPPIGAAVVYGDGIRTDLDLTAVNDLNNKEGIKADLLEGGFAAWEASSLPTTCKNGLGKSNIHYISYQEFEKVAAMNPDIILVDLRTAVPFRGKTEPGEKAVHQDGLSPDAAGQPITDLSKQFPGVNTIKLSRKSLSAKKRWDIASGILKRENSTARHHSLYVLVDNCDGESEKVAHRLMAAGVKRIAILIGGEQSLQGKGRPALMQKETKFE